MFEELRDDLQFRGMTTEQRQQHFDQYKQNVLMPEFEKRALPEEKRQRVLQKVENEYANVAYKTEWQAFKDAATDIVLGLPGRFLAGVREPGMIEKGIASAVDYLTGDDSWKLALVEKSNKLKEERLRYTFSADAAKWHDTAAIGVATGAGVGGLMYKYSTMASQWAQPFIQATAQGLGRSAASSAFSSGVGEVAIESAMSNLVTPAIEKTSWDDTTKGYATLASYLVLGLGSGATLEYKLDKVIGNPLFTRTIDGLVEKVSKQPFPNLTREESALKHLVADPEQLRALGKAFNEALDPVSPTTTEATLAAGNRKLQALIDREMQAESDQLNLRRSSGIAKATDLTDAEQSRFLANLIDNELDQLAAQRAKTIEEPDYHMMKFMDESDDVAEVFEGAKVEAPVVEGAAPETGIRYFARLNSENKIVFRASAKPSKEVLAALKEVGLTWQPKKLFDPNDPSTKGVYYGANTPEAHAKVREIFETNGQPVSGKPAKSAEGKKLEAQQAAVAEAKAAEADPNKFSVSGIDGNTMVRVSTENEAAVTRLGELGFGYDETLNAFVGKSNLRVSSELKKLGLEPEAIPVKPQTPEAKGLQKRLADAEAGKDIPATSKAVPVKSDTQVLRDGWRGVVENGKPVVTKLSNRLRANFRWLDEGSVSQRYPQAHKALTGDLGVRSIKEGFTFDDIVRTTVNEYNRFRPGQLLEPEELAAHMRKLSELEDMIDSGWKDQPRKTATMTIGDAEYPGMLKGLNKLQETGIMSREQFVAVAKVLNNFKQMPDFLLDVAPEKMKSFFSFLNNTIYLRRTDDFFHETGHWIWTHGLSKQDRLDFFEKAMTKYGDTEAWDALWPVRKQYAAATDKDPATYPFGVYTGHFQNVTELYADMFRQYIHSYHMPTPETRGVMAKMLKLARAVYKPLLETGQEIPKDMRRFFENTVNAPIPRKGKLRLAEMEDLVQRQRLYQDRETFMQTLREHEQRTDAFVNEVPTDKADEFLLDVLTHNDSALDALTRSGANVEGVLNRVYRDVLALHHVEVGDEKMLDVVMDRLRGLFDEGNKPEMIERLKGAGTDKVQNKYGINTDEGSTMPTVATETEARRQFAKSTESTEEHYARGAELQYRAMKEFYNEVANLHSASKFYRRNFPKTGANAAKRADVVAMAQEEWGNLVIRLGDEELLRRQPTVSLDIDGSVDEFADRRFASDDSPFQNAFQGFTDEEIRYVQLKLWPQAVSFMLGLETDSENGVPIPFTGVNLNWSFENWVDRGGPALSAYMALNKGIRAKTKQVMLNRWQTLEPELKQELTRKWKAVTKHPAVRVWREGDGLDVGLQKLLKQKRAIDTKFRRQFFDTADELNRRLSIDEQRMVAELITKHGDIDVTDASPRVRASAQIVQNLFSGIKQDLIAAGVPENLVTQFGDDFLPQVFQSHAKSWFMQGTEGRRMRNLYESINAKFLAPQGITNTLRSADREMQYLMQGVRQRGLRIEPGMMVDEFVDEAGERMLVPRSEVTQGTPLQTWKVQSYDMRRGKLNLHRPYSSLERQMLREETSVVPRLVEFGKQASKLIAQSRTMQSIAANNNLTIDPAVLVRELGQDAADQAVARFQREGWQIVPDTEAMPGMKRYGALAGKLVDPEAMYVLRNITSAAPEHPFWSRAFTLYKQGVSLWKIGKTAFNVTTHGINFLGNSAMCVMDGRNPVDVLRRGAMALKERGDLYNQAVSAGMLDSNILRSELGLDDFMRLVERMPNANPSQGAESAIGAWMQGIMNSGKKWGGKAAYWPMRIYELGDQVYKMGVFAQEIAAGKNAEEALDAANKLFFDYGNVPTSVKVIRDLGIMPFVSYTYKLIPRLADFAVNNPHRMIGLMGTLQLANEIIMHQEWGEDFKDVQKWQESVMPDWMNRNVWGTSQRGGIMTGADKNEFGHEYTEWLDYNQIIPGASLLNDGGIFGGLPFGSNPILSIVVGLANNKDQYLGQQIAPYPEAENIEMQKRNTEARLKFVMRTLLPNLPIYPGAYSLERLGQALTGSGVISKEVANSFGWTGQDYYGTQEDILPEMLGYMTGIRNRRLYATQETIRGIEKNKFGIKKEENELRRRLNDKRTSPSETDSQVNKFKSVILHNTDQIDRLGQVYRKAQKVLAQQESER